MDRAFLFVNHDARTLGERTDFKTINAHIRSCYRKQRRQPLVSPSSRSLPVDQLMVVHRQKRVRAPHSPASEVFTQSKSTSHPTQDSTMSCQNRVDTENVFCETRNISVGSLTSMLQKGNSDPFSSLAAPINPTVNLLMSWHRDVDLPTQYPYENRGLNNSTSTGLLRDWQRAVTAIQDPCMAHAFISSLAGCMTLSTGKQDCVQLGLVSKIKASQVLRTYSGGKYAWTCWKVYEVIISMVWADIATGDLAPAGLHMGMLYHLIRLHGRPEAFDAWWRGKIIWADVEYAAMQLSKPLFDVDRWSFEEYYTDWMEDAKIEEYWNSNLPEFSNLDPLISDDATKAIFKDLKKLLVVEKYHSVHPPPITCLVYQWMRARKIRCESQLLSRYANVSTLTQDKDSSSDLDDHLVKECTCLAAIAWVAVSYDYVAESKKRLRHIIMRKYGQFLFRLRKSIIRCSNLLLPRLRLWILYAGALLEQCVLSDSGERVFGNWHQSRLVTQAGLMGLTSFHQVREVLFDFLFMDRMKFIWPLNN